MFLQVICAPHLSLPCFCFLDTAQGNQVGILSIVLSLPEFRRSYLFAGSTLPPSLCLLPFVTRQGTFRNTRVHFQILPSPGTRWRSADKLLRGLPKFPFKYSVVVPLPPFQDQSVSAPLLLLCWALSLRKFRDLYKPLLRLQYIWIRLKCRGIACGSMKRSPSRQAPRKCLPLTSKF